MIRSFFLAAAAAGVALSVAPAAAAPARKAPPVQRDWSRMVVMTPEGGYRMGNPSARVKLVEYGSLTCGHCARFAHDAGVGLREHVKRGRVSWEFRPYLLFPSDPGISMLLRCNGPATVFQTADRIYAEQPTWMRKLRTLSEQIHLELSSMSPQERATALVRAAGVDAIFRESGMSETRIAACLADRSGLDALVTITTRASGQEGVMGTPTFFINGANIGPQTWESLEPILREAAG